MARGALSTSGAAIGVSTGEIVALAKANVGIQWTANGCTDFAWGISNLAGLPFFDLTNKTTNGNPTLPQDVIYSVPHSWDNNASGDGWDIYSTSNSVSTLKNILMPGDIVRVYGYLNNSTETSNPINGHFQAHEFIVVSNSSGNIQVIDNWSTSTFNTQDKIVQHSFQDIVDAFAPNGTFYSAYVSRIDDISTPWLSVSGNFNNTTLQGNAFGSSTIWNSFAQASVAVGSVSISDVSIAEGNSGTRVATFTVTRTGGTAAFNVNYATSDGGAMVGDGDYVATSGTLSFGANVNTQPISVTINGDTNVESDQSFFVNLSGATNGAAINDSLGIGTILNDDSTVAVGSVSISDVSITEGNSGTKVATFTVTRTGGTAAFNVNYATSDGGATVADGDYVAASGTLAFGANVNTRTISVTINGDTRVESDQSFYVNLSGATNGAGISDSLGIGTILNDDGASQTPTLTLSPTIVGHDEGNAGATTDFNFLVTLTGPISQQVTAQWYTTWSTTFDLADFTGAYNGNLSFMPGGPSTQTITMHVLGDNVAEPDESFVVHLINADGAQIDVNASLATGNVRNDDTSAIAGAVSNPAGTQRIDTTPPPASNFTFSDTSTNTSTVADGDSYSGPVAGIQHQFISVTTDSLAISATAPNSFIHTGAGDDAIDVSKVGGTNVLDGSTGSNFLVGGSGDDTFFLDDRGPTADIWSTVVGFHAGDNATTWDVTPDAFTLNKSDNQGAAGYTGLTFGFTAAGKPNASLTLAGYTTADLSSGRLAVTYGTTPDLPGVPGSTYMLVHAN
jgi:Calx-beta domain